jgi:hypothetical protein
VTSRAVRLPGDRSRVRLLAVTAALDLLRRRLPPARPDPPAASLSADVAQGAGPTPGG